MQDKKVLLLILVFLFGLSIRLQAVRLTEVDTPVRADARDYLLYALNMQHYGVYSRSPDALESKLAKPQPDALRSPGYPLFMRLFLGEKVTVQTLTGIELAQALLSALTVLLAYAAFANLLKPPLALAVAGLTAISPHLITANVFLLSESLFGFLLLAFVWQLSRLQAAPSRRSLFAAGWLLACTALTRPWTQYFILFLLPLLAFAAPLPKRERAAAWLALGFALPVGVWLLRNLITLGVAGDNTLTMNMLHHGLYPGMMYDNQPESLGYPYRFDPRSAEIAASVRSVLAEIARRFQAEPLGYLQWFVFGKPVMLFSWDIFEGVGDVFIYPILHTPYQDSTIFILTHWLMQMTHEIWLVLAGVGALAAWRRGLAGWVGVENQFFARCVSALFLYFIAVHCIGAPFARYAIPMLPIVYGLAMLGLGWLSRTGWQAWTLLRKKPG